MRSISIMLDDELYDKIAKYKYGHKLASNQETVIMILRKGLFMEENKGEYENEQES